MIYMKRKKFKILAVLLMIVVLCVEYTCLHASAAIANENEDIIIPYMQNCNMCTCSFTTNDSQAHIGVRYNGKSETFFQARITVKIQKRYMGLFWKTIEIEGSDNQWTTTCNDVYGYVIKSFDIENSGTYRALFSIEIIGKDGSIDLIEDTIESIYD